MEDPLVEEPEADEEPVAGGESETVSGGEQEAVPESDETESADSGGVAGEPASSGHRTLSFNSIFALIVIGLVFIGTAVMYFKNSIEVGSFLLLAAIGLGFLDSFTRVFAFKSLSGRGHSESGGGAGGEESAGESAGGEESAGE